MKRERNRGGTYWFKEVTDATHNAMRHSEQRARSRLQTRELIGFQRCSRRAPSVSVSSQEVTGVAADFALCDESMQNGFCHCQSCFAVASVPRVGLINA